MLEQLQVAILLWPVPLFLVLFHLRGVSPLFSVELPGSFYILIFFPVPFL